ncbi:MAG: hypothetical protein ABI903_04490 [Actinomycetota bacterium]
MLRAIAGSLLLLVCTAAAIFYLRSYRPTRVPVVERARTSHDLRARVRAARQRLRLRRQRHAGRNQAQPQAPRQQPPARRILKVTAVNPATPAPPAPFAHPWPLVQPVLAHQAKGAPQPGSSFRTVEATCPESLTSDVRGPWAAQIVDVDGRITLPDNGLDVALTWRHAEDAPPADFFLS